MHWRLRLTFLLCSWLALVLLPVPAAAAEPPPYRLGIMPFNSAMTLIRTHQPLAAHLERELGRKVNIFTASDYFAFINQLLAGDFDLAIAGPHFGAMAQERGQHALLLRYRTPLQPVFVVRTQSPIRHLEDLRGRSLALSSRLSISSIGGVKWLQDRQFVLGRDYQLTEYSSHGAAVAAVAIGEQDVAVTTHTPLRQIPEDIRARVRVLPLDIQMPHLMTLAHHRLGSAEIARVRQALQHFEQTPAGERFFRDTGYQGYAEITAADLRQLQPFVDLTVQMMRLPR